MSQSEKALDPKEVAAVEKFLIDSQFRIHQLMEHSHISRADLAKKLNCSKSRVSQMFGDRPNLTLETLARVFYALDDECRITSDRVEAILGGLKQELAARLNRGAHTWKICEAKRVPESVNQQISDKILLLFAGTAASYASSRKGKSLSESFFHVLTNEKLGHVGGVQRQYESAFNDVFDEALLPAVAQ